MKCRAGYFNNEALNRSRILIGCFVRVGGFRLNQEGWLALNVPTCDYQVCRSLVPGHTEKQWFVRRKVSSKPLYPINGSFLNFDPKSTILTLNRIGKQIFLKMQTGGSAKTFSVKGNQRLSTVIVWILPSKMLKNSYYDGCFRFIQIWSDSCQSNF